MECTVSVRQTLKSSCNKKNRNLYHLPNSKNVNTDGLINSIDIAEKHLFRNKTESVLSKTTKETIWNEFLDLKEQCGIINQISCKFDTNVTSSTVYRTVNFVNIKRLSYIYLITVQPPLNDRNGDTSLSSKQL